HLLFGLACSSLFGTLSFGQDTTFIIKKSKSLSTTLCQKNKEAGSFSIIKMRRKCQFLLVCGKSKDKKNHANDIKTAQITSVAKCASKITRLSGTASVRSENNTKSIHFVSVLCPK